MIIKLDCGVLQEFFCAQLSAPTRTVHTRLFFSLFSYPSPLLHTHSRLQPLLHLFPFFFVSSSLPLLGEGWANVMGSECTRKKTQKKTSSSSIFITMLPKTSKVLGRSAKRVVIQNSKRFYTFVMADFVDLSVLFFFSHYFSRDWIINPLADKTHLFFLGPVPSLLLPRAGWTSTSLCIPRLLHHNPPSSLYFCVLMLPDVVSPRHQSPSFPLPLFTQDAKCLHWNPPPTVVTLAFWTETEDGQKITDRLPTPTIPPITAAGPFLSNYTLMV